MDEISLSDYLRILTHRKWIIISTMVAALLIAVIALAIMPKTYEGETTLMFPGNTMGGITPQVSQLMSFALPGMNASFSGRDVYVTVLKSRTMSDNVCKRLALDRYDITYVQLQKNLQLETTKEGSLDIKYSVPTSWLKGQVPKSELQKRTADLSCDIANAYVSELERYDRSNILFMGKKFRLFIESQVRRAKSELTDAEVRLRAFQQAHPTLIPPNNSDEYASQMLQLANKQVESDVGFDEAEGQLNRARMTWNAGAPKGISPQALVDNPALAELRTGLAKLEIARATLLENFTPDHPDVVSLNQQIDKTYSTINSEVEHVIGGQTASMSPAHQELLKEIVTLEVTRDGMEARKSALATAMTNIEKKLSSLPAAELQYARLLRDCKATETVYLTLLAEQAKARVTEGRDSDNFIVLDSAIAPEKPSKPKIKLTLAAAMLIGIIFGLLVAAAQGVPNSKRASLRA